MEKIKVIGGFALVVAVLVGALILAGVRSDTPTEEVVSNGESVEVTPVDKMRVRTAEGQPEIDIEDYALRVSGLVAEEVEFDFEELRELPAEERFVELPCVEGWTEKGTWKGPLLSDVLDMAGVEEGAETVVFSSPNGYTTSLTLEDVEETAPMLAYQVNGERLPDEQGYPVRLVVPDRLGYKWIKWVTGIELIEGIYEDGYWESRGYSNEADATGR